jgi:hypothetical protein
VTALRAGEPPPGARAFDVVAASGLAVDLGRTASLRLVVSAVRVWLARGAPRRAVRLGLDGDVLGPSSALVSSHHRKPPDGWLGHNESG